MNRKPISPALKRQIPQDEVEFRAASRKLLFGEREDQKLASVPSDRHLRVRVTMNLDADIVRRFKERADQTGTPYQVLINQILREHLDGTDPEQMAKTVGDMLIASDSFLDEIAARMERK